MSPAYERRQRVGGGGESQIKNLQLCGTPKGELRANIAPSTAAAASDGMKLNCYNPSVTVIEQAFERT